MLVTGSTACGHGDIHIQAFRRPSRDFSYEISLKNSHMIHGNVPLPIEGRNDDETRDHAHIFHVSCGTTVVIMNTPPRNR